MLRPAPEHVVALVVLATVLTLGSIASLVVNPAGTDFASFYASGQAFRAGQSFYPLAGDPNLNPPSVVGLIFAPLASLSPSWAAGIWSVVGILAAGLALRLIASELALSTSSLVIASGLLMATPGAMAGWFQGQMTWCLLLLVTLAWRAYRQGRMWVAGAWLAPVIAAKPFFAVAALPLGFAVVLSAGLGSLALTLAGIAATGWAPWAEWLSLSGEVRWLAEPANASWAGFLARAMTTHPLDRIGLDAFGPIALSLWSVMAVVVLGATARVQDPDARWTAAVLGTILAAPLGWIYYLPVAAGSLLAIGWRWPMWALLVPFPVVGLVLEPHLLFVLAGSIYTWGLMAVWLTIVWNSLTALGAVRPAPWIWERAK